MDHVRSGLEHRAAAVALLAAGLVVLAISLFVEGKGGANLGRLGSLALLLGTLRVGYVSRTVRAQSTHRFLRCQQRTDKTASSRTPVREDA